jgi:ferritin
MATLNDLLNKQVELELFSAELYLWASLQADLMGWRRYGADLRGHASEEHAHARMWIAHIADRDGSLVRATMPDRAQDRIAGVSDYVKLAEMIWEHEKLVTRTIASVAETADREGDPACAIWARLQLAEQVEEEAGALDLLRTARICKSAAEFEQLI